LLVLANSLFANGAKELTSKERAKGREYEAEFSKITHKFVSLQNTMTGTEVADSTHGSSNENRRGN